ncbi:MAG: hypothetical protein P4L85_22730 [Paludisphaera borealis]|uniref:hypothetical protein n=1 Tax=Paludisphaera borealis TaxID=1387353 RepID=UPI002847F7D5|nr:hypothetical protein [Paludisphaera borealis]MDR3622183.1 hypothetical protein [Paludisphaera borealis]
MRPAHLAAGFPAFVIASLALGLAPPLAAQNDSGLSSGSGSGTGTGRSAGVFPPPGTRSPLRGPGRGGAVAPFREDSGRRRGAPYGPGINVQFPDDPILAPFLSLEERDASGRKTAMRITPEMIETAKQMTEAGERGRILLQITRGAILGNQLTTANKAIVEAAAAADEERNPLIHDQLIISIVTTAGLLSDALLREAKPQGAFFADDARNEAIASARIAPDVAIRLARLEWRRSIYMAARIKSATYRSEYLERAIENMANGSATIALEYAKLTEGADPAKKQPNEKQDEYKKQADEILLEAVEAAQQIERPIWKNQALERIAVAAGQSDQYDRATEIAAGIENAEARARALVLVAESQARQNQNDAATQSYNLVGQAVSSIQQNGLRGVLTGILIDSLISTGRFEDARASLVLYPSDSERFVAMGAIAESQGVRRMATEARAWIDHDVPAEYRSTLYRRLSNGRLRAISEDRAREFQGRDLDETR